MGIKILENFKFDEVTLNNYEIIFKLVKNHFCLDDNSIKRFKDYLYNPRIDEVYYKYIKDTNDLRKRWILDIKDRKEVDRGWEEFKNIFIGFYASYDMSYENFYNNKIKVNKNEIKLSKALFNYYYKNESANRFSLIYNDEDKLKEAIRKDLERIGAISLPKKQNLEMVLTLNFADWFLCSTAEKWSSCLNLESNYNECFWGGLPGLIVDTNRAMFYITSQNKKNYENIQVENVLSKTWILIDKNEKIFQVNWYPNESFERKKIYNITGIEFQTLYDNDYSCAHTFKPLFNEYKESIFIYQDDTKFYEINNNKINIIGGSSSFYYFEENSYNIYTDSIYDYDGGLKALILHNETLLEADNKNCYYCDHCDERISKNDSYYVVDGNIYCEYCYKELFVHCYECGEPVLNNESYITPNEHYVCESCFDELYITCDKCGESEEKNKSIEVRVYEYYCENCAERYLTRCNDCDEYFEEDIFEAENGEYFCNDCAENNNMEMCSEKKLLFYKKDMIQDEYKNWYSKISIEEMNDKKQIKFIFETA